MNYISGLLFKFIPLDVVLYGVAKILSEKERTDEMVKVTSGNGVVLSENTVKASFDAPKIRLGLGTWLERIITALPLKIFPEKSMPTLSLFLQKMNIIVSVGPPSSVVLDTPYADNTLRVGVGSRGSLFLFERLERATNPTLFLESEQWVNVARNNPLDAKSVAIGASMVGMAAGATGRHVIGLVLSAISVLLYYWKGGIAEDEVKKVDAKTPVTA